MIVDPINSIISYGGTLIGGTVLVYAMSASLRYEGDSSYGNKERERERKAKTVSI
jgi:hypothetical protein